MTKTRSQTERENQAKMDDRNKTLSAIPQMVHTDSPASPTVVDETVREQSNVVPANQDGRQPPPAQTTGNVTRTELDVDGKRHDPPPPPPASSTSARATASGIARIKQLEYEAEERLAAIRRQNLEMDAMIVRKRLAMEVAQVREEMEFVSPENVMDSDPIRKVGEWFDLNQSRPPGERLPQNKGSYPTATTTFDGPLSRTRAREIERFLPRDEVRTRPIETERYLSLDESRARQTETERHLPRDESRTRPRETERYLARNQSPPRPKETERFEPRAYSPNRVRYTEQYQEQERDRRQRSPTPGKSRERGIDRLAEAMEKMLQGRPPQRQVQDLPLFSGAMWEWLPFKAAMRDSTRLYGFTRLENLARLRNCLRGEARQKVAALLSTATDPEEIMQTLEQSFARPELMIQKTLGELKALPRPGPTAQSLNSFAIDVQNIVSVLRGIDNRGYLQNPMLTREVTEKLSDHMQSRWCDYASDHCSPNEPEVITLSRFLMREADRALRHNFSIAPPARTAITKNPQNTKNFAQHKGRNTAGVFSANTDGNTADKKKQACLCCGGKHEVPKCGKFTSMTIPQRWEWLKTERICFKCINSRHRRTTCTSKLCGVRECKHPHHAMLHNDSPPLSSSDNSQDDNSSPAETVTSTSVLNKNKKVLLKVCPIKISGPNGVILTHALLDEGSTVTLVDEDIARAIGATGPAQKLQINGVTSSRCEESSQNVQLRVQGRASDESFTIHAKTVKELKIGSQTVSDDCLTYAHMNKLPTVDVCYEMARPRLLIGADNWHLIVTRKLLTGKRHEPAASLTQLGWIVHGTVPRKVLTGDGETVLHLYAPEHHSPRYTGSSTEPTDRLEELVKSYFEVDSLGVSILTKPNEHNERAQRIFSQTAKNIGGRYEVGLLWHEDNVIMPPSYEMALRRLCSIERKMDKSPTFKQEYTAQIHNLLNKGYAIESDDSDNRSPVRWFLPHFAVTNINKPGKVRQVFDAAASTNGVCLNDKLLDGPDLLRALPGILFRFREKAIALTADVREMFLQVKIRKEDQPAQLFLWRGDDRKNPPTVYKMTSMIFGARSSPFLAHSVRNKNALDHADTHPRALYAITQSHYMDDLVDSYDDEKEAIETLKEVNFVHSQAGFTLASWDSNSAEVLNHVPTELLARAPKELGSNDARQYGKTLGLLWYAEADELRFNTSLNRVPTEVRTLSRAPTKREALSAVMSVFDPLGLLSYYTVTAKILLQNTWRQKIEWDEPLPVNEAQEFNQWLRGMDGIAELRLPRCYDSTGGVIETERQLHVFNDASELAYATVAYWRIKHGDGTVKVVLAAAKAKVAPVKTQSIPRLELQANLIGARLADTIQREHRWKPEKIVYWSDSRTALHWIRNNATRYTAFVAHRLGEIAELTDSRQWRWLPSELNVADDATRPNYTAKSETNRWFIGPAFLYNDEKSWPTESSVVETDDEVMVTHLSECETAVAYLPEISRFSSYERLIRTTARVLAFIDLCRKKTAHMELRHIERAERLWLQNAQQTNFNDEIARIQSGKKLPQASRLKKLDPMLDDGLLKVRGRIGAARVPAEMKRPIILDGRHPFTRLLVQHEHCRGGHLNNERTVNDLRQRYWILRLRPTVKAVAYACARCKIRCATPHTLPMGDLPAARVEPFTRPFSNCGVDYFGPMTVTIGRRHEKRWGALFTCLSTRAVHIELVSSLSTDSAIMALRRMSARRGWPKLMYSDNATNFKGADVELQSAIREWEPALRDLGLQQRMAWRYIAPGAPNQGGAWERLVRSIKTALKVTLNERSPKEEVLSTLLTEAEYSVNARPLTHVATNVDDPEALTPNHFLLGSSTGLPYTGPCELLDRRAWRASQALADKFWQRWIKEYLPTLIPRGSSAQESYKIKEGDLVIVVDATLPRNVWPRGVVQKVYPGPDGEIRNVDVKTRGGIFKRPASKLAVLPIGNGATEVLRQGEDVTDRRSK